MDDLGLGLQHVHQVTARHEVEEEVEVVLVLISELYIDHNYNKRGTIMSIM